MILVAGSSLVSDSGYTADLDIIYVTVDPAKYTMYVLLRERINKRLCKKFGRPVVFSPYLACSPAIVGNMFLAVTLLRYPYSKGSFLLKLSLARKDLRWILIHLAFGVFGLLSASTVRDLCKYCSMLAENILYVEGASIPNSWRNTIKLAYALSKKSGYNKISKLFKTCLAYVNNCMTNIRLRDDNLRWMLADSLIDFVEEFLERVVKVNANDIDKLRLRWDNMLRRFYERIFAKLYGLHIRWVDCSSTLLALVQPGILRRIIVNKQVVESAKRIYSKCKSEIPVLSPLAHP